MLISYGFYFDRKVVTEMDGFNIKDCTGREYCNNMKCRTNSAKPIGFVKDFGKIKIVLKCSKCGNIYDMDFNTYRHKYLGGTNMKGQHVSPAILGGLPEHVKEMNKRNFQKKQEKMFGKENIERWEKQREEDHKRYLKQEEKRMADLKNEQIKNELQKKSETRKTLIAQGILKYDKKNRCLINTETGEMVPM